MQESKKIKILYTIPNFDTAGSGKVLYDLAKYLDINKFEVEIACQNNKGSFFKEVEELGLPIHIIKCNYALRPYWTLFFRVKPLVKFLKSNKINIVHSWNWSSNWTEIMACKLANISYVYTKKAMNWGFHWKIKSFLADFIITINDEMKGFFSYKKNQKLIPIGIDTAYFDPKLFLEKPNKNYKFQIITVANLVEVKNIEVLINAIKLLNLNDIHLQIVGDSRSEYAQGLKEMVKDLGLNETIEFIDKQNDVRQFLAAANLYVICSKHEGMPMALVEAMTMAVPVLGSNIVGVNYVLKQFPELLFQDGNSEELAFKINQLIQKTESERGLLGENLRNYCVNHFSMKNFIDSHQEVYINLVK